MRDLSIYGTACLAAVSQTPFRAIGRWYRERRAASALLSLDDAALKDIGVYRCEIPSIARARCAEPGWS